MRRDLPADVAERATVDYRPDLAPWSHAEMLMAALLDAVRLETQVLIAVNGGGKPSLDPTPRPGIPPVAPKRRLTDDQRRALDPRLRTPTRED